MKTRKCIILLNVCLLLFSLDSYAERRKIVEFKNLVEASKTGTVTAAYHFGASKCYEVLDTSESEEVALSGIIPNSLIFWSSEVKEPAGHGDRNTGVVNTLVYSFNERIPEGLGTESKVIGPTEEIAGRVNVNNETIIISIEYHNDSTDSKIQQFIKCSFRDVEFFADQ